MAASAPLLNYITKCKDKLGGDAWLKAVESERLGHETLGAIIKRYITHCYIEGVTQTECVKTINKKFPTK